MISFSFPNPTGHPVGFSFSGNLWARLAPVLGKGFCLALLLSNAVQAQPQDMVRAHDALKYAGEYAMVCGVIASANYLRDVRGGPTYLNFDKPYPKHDFSAIIFEKNRKHFNLEPETLGGYKACVYGKIKVYKGKAQIVLVKANQLSVKAPKNRD